MINLLKKLFPPKEIKEALGMLEEAEREFSSKDFHLVKGHIEKILRSHPDKFVEIIKRGETPRQWIYSTISNIAGDLVESGNYHIYRGVINPMGPGNELLKIYNKAIDKLVEMKVLDKERAEKEKSALQKNINNVG